MVPSETRGHFGAQKVKKYNLLAGITDCKLLDSLFGLDSEQCMYVMVFAKNFFFSAKIVHKNETILSIFL